MLYQIGRSLQSHEMEIIQDALRFYQGNKTRTASALGICVATLRTKLGETDEKEETKEVERPAPIRASKKRV
jgi:DNA-binding NtrC family response regulator